MAGKPLIQGAKRSVPIQTEDSASIEALYAASIIVGSPCYDLLDGYYWKDVFLERNRELLTSVRY